MLPARNRRDYDDIPEIARKEMEFVWLERVEEAVAAALEPAKPAEKTAASRAAARGRRGVSRNPRRPRARMDCRIKSGGDD